MYKTAEFKMFVFIKMWNKFNTSKDVFKLMFAYYILLIFLFGLACLFFFLLAEYCIVSKQVTPKRYGGIEPL